MNAAINDVLALVRPDLQGFAGYSSARSERLDGDLWLNANESAWRNLADAEAACRRYPDPQPPRLREALAGLYGVPGAVVMTHFPFRFVFAEAPSLVGFSGFGASRSPGPYLYSSVSILQSGVVSFAASAFGTGHGCPGTSCRLTELEVTSRGSSPDVSNRSTKRLKVEPW